MNNLIYNCIQRIQSESDKIARLDCLGMDILDKFSQISNDNKEITIITFNKQVIKSIFKYYEFVFDTETVRTYLIEENKIPFEIVPGEELIKKYKNEDLLLIDNKFKLDIREIAFVIIENEIIYDYADLNCKIILEKWIRNE